MNDFLDEEMDIMKEQMEEGSEHSVSQGISIEDPIKTLNLDHLVTIKESASLKQTVEFMNEKNVGCLVVVDASEKAVGIFSERDILKRVCAQGLNLETELLKTYMTKDPETLDINDPIAYALNAMSAGSYRNIPILQDGKPKYMLSVKDIVDHISFTYRKNVMNLPPDPHQKGTQYGG